jgi:hypothetical protein
MAELRGALGAVFKGAAAIYSEAIEFDADNDIVDPNNGFVTAGFVKDQKINVYGSLDNDGVYTISSVAAGKIVVIEDVSGESGQGKYFIYTAAPGTQVTGFYSWTLDWEKVTIDATDFADAGAKTFIAGDEGWTATAQAHWMSDEDVESLMGKPMLIRFFVKYSASPSAPAPVYLYEGMAIISGLQVDVNVNELVQRPLTFTGVSPLVYRALTAYP